MSWIQSDLQQSQSAYVPPEWSSGTDEEIVEALEKHYNGEVDLTEYWSVGDTRVVSLSSMSSTSPVKIGESHAAQDVTFVLSNIGGKYLSDGITECVFQVDQLNSLNEGGYMWQANDTTGGWKYSTRRTWCNSTYYNAIPSTLRSIFKEFINQSGQGGTTQSGTYNTTDYFALRAEVEIFGSTTYSVTGEGSQVTWYETSVNRIKQRGNEMYPDWWERSHFFRNNYMCYVTYEGVASAYSCSDIKGLAPFGVI